VAAVRPAGGFSEVSRTSAPDAGASTRTTSMLSARTSTSPTTSSDPLPGCQSLSTTVASVPTRRTLY
jgi:hypothetical protein